MMLRGVLKDALEHISITKNDLNLIVVNRNKNEQTTKGQSGQNDLMPMKNAFNMYAYSQGEST